MCPSGCADLNTDGHNCGTCGHDCQGGACQGAKCQPVVLASGQDHPVALAVDAGNVYSINSGTFSQGDGAVMRVPISGGPPTPLATSQPFPQGIAVDGTSVYWSASQAGEIRKTPVNGGAITSLASGQDGPGPIAIDSTQVYWANINLTDPTIRRVLKIGGFVITAVSNGVPPGANGLAVDSTNIYVTVRYMGISDVERYPLSGSSRTVIGPGGFGQVMSDGSNVYWADGGTNMVHKTPASAADASSATNLATNQAAPWGIALDATSVYWSNSGNGTIMKVALTGGVPVELASGQTTPYGIVADTSAIYWVNNVAGGSVTKLAK